MSILWQPKTIPLTRLPSIPDPVPLPSDAPSLDVRPYIVDPDFPIELIDRIILITRSLASIYGVALYFDSPTNLDRPDWLDVTAEDSTSIWNFALTVKPHVLLFTHSIYILGRFDAGIGTSEYTVISAQASDSTFLHELGHSAGLSHLDEPRNVMNPVSHNENTVFNADQAAKFYNWVRTRPRG